MVRPTGQRSVISPATRPGRSPASLALARPGSPVTVPILASLAAIDTELAARAPRQQPGRSPRGTVIGLCSCGFGTSNPDWLDGHLHQHPGHHQRPQP